MSLKMRIMRISHLMRENGEKDYDRVSVLQLLLERKCNKATWLSQEWWFNEGTVPTGVMDTFMHRKPSSKQPSIKHALKGVKAIAALTKHVVKNIIKWFLHAEVSAHTTSSPYFQTMIDFIGKAGPGLKAPTLKDIYGKHLEEELVETKEWVASFKAIWMANGCTFMCDGWTGTTRRFMINFLVLVGMYQNVSNVHDS
ncbi:hypothetical protein Taro_016479 [Colocasia esculenta]|uniref:DUF659 domain-containing protein n=1 Tax=Colocasia esculenta TaxID=4460 RepID=A0A843UKU1_COLES|nr:hypothetical protein [Colocasia esculenta]